MDQLLPDYHVSAATWFYLSLLLIVAVFFRFNRVWSVRNLDLALLLSMSPGVLLVQEGHRFGYAWLFAASGLVLCRLFADQFFERRPRLPQNLNRAGMTFLAIAALAFLVTRVVTETPSASSVQIVRQGEQILNREAPPDEARGEGGPASSLIAASIHPFTQVVAQGNGDAAAKLAAEPIAARLLAIFAHFAVIGGLVLLGRRHFQDTGVGLAMGTLYVLLPCTAYNVHEVNHVLPAAFLVWAFVAYRQPLVAGCLMALACGTLFFPIFLVPLWLAFYGRKGAVRFGLALCGMGAVLVGSFALTAVDGNSFAQQWSDSIDWGLLSFRGNSAAGFWNAANEAYRIPVFVAFLLAAFGLTVFPLRKNLEHLLAHSAALIVGTQFWYPNQSGAYILWYLPLLLLVVFRPRLENLRPPEYDSRRQREHEQDRRVPQTASAMAGGRTVLR
ncbi:MAG: hypothetical protein WD069_05810 [Planctomycetales bacterium]